jgi:hypothetical protein
LDAGALQLAPAGKKKLAAGREAASQSKKLAEIYCDVPLGSGIFAKKKELDKGKLYDFCKNLELFSVIKKLNLSPAENAQLQMSFDDM